MYTEDQNTFPENQPPINPQPNFPMGQVPTPNATTVLVLGIVSIVTACCCYGIIGLVLAIISLVMAKKAKDIYYSNPNVYTPGSLSNINAGRICAIIALVVGILVVISYIVLFTMFGSGVLTDPQKLQEILQRRM